MRFKKTFVTVGASAVMFGTLIGANAASANTVTILESVRVVHECVSESETETVYYHLHDGVYVKYVPAKVEHTASENHPLICTTKTTKHYVS